MKDQLVSSQLKSAAYFHFPVALPVFATPPWSVMCGRMGAAEPLGSPSVSRRSLRSAGTNRTASGSLCAGGGASPRTQDSPAPWLRSDALNTTAQDANTRPSEMTFYVVFVDNPPARSDGTKSEGPIYHSHSRKINLHLILNFPVLTFKAI